MQNASTIATTRHPASRGNVEQVADTCDESSKFLPPTGFLLTGCLEQSNLFIFK